MSIATETLEKIAEALAGPKMKHEDQTGFAIRMCRLDTIRIALADVRSREASPDARHVALSEFRSLGYTDLQAHDLVATARQLAAASGLTLDDSERILYRALLEHSPKPQRYSPPRVK